MDQASVHLCITIHLAMPTCRNSLALSLTAPFLCHQASLVCFGTNNVVAR